MLFTFNVYPQFAIFIDSLICLNCCLTSVVCWLPLQTIRTQIRPNETSGMIWIQTAWHSTDIPERSFTKKQHKKTNWFWKKISADDKTMTNYLVGKRSQWIEMEGATCTCMFHASALYLPAFKTARSRTPIDSCVCACVCVKMMTSEVWGIDFHWIFGYRYSCRLVHIIIAMQIYHVYLLGYT